MATVEIHVKGERREFTFPQGMPPGVWSCIVQIALNAVAAAEITRGRKVRNPAAYAWAAMDEYARAWGDPRRWPEREARLADAAARRRRMRSVLDLGAALQRMQRARGQSCWPQLRAVTGHDIGHPAAGPGACPTCVAAVDGDWPAFSRRTGLDAITMENCYRGVQAAGLVPETPWRDTRPDHARSAVNHGWEDGTDF